MCLKGSNSNASCVSLGNISGKNAEGTAKIKTAVLSLIPYASTFGPQCSFSKQGWLLCTVSFTAFGLKSVKANDFDINTQFLNMFT